MNISFLRIFTQAVSIAVAMLLAEYAIGCFITLEPDFTKWYLFATVGGRITQVVILICMAVVAVGIVAIKNLKR